VLTAGVAPGVTRSPKAGLVAYKPYIYVTNKHEWQWPPDARWRSQQPLILNETRSHSAAPPVLARARAMTWIFTHCKCEIFVNSLHSTTTLQCVWAVSYRL